MWVNTITQEIIKRFIVEMKKKENVNDIQLNILDPIIKYAFSQLYPYIMVTSIIFFLTFMLAIAILFFVIRDHMKA